VELGAAFRDERVELVEEDYAGYGAAGALEDLAESALGFADVLVMMLASCSVVTVQRGGSQGVEQIEA